MVAWVAVGRLGSQKTLPPLTLPRYSPFHFICVYSRSFKNGSLKFNGALTNHGSKLFGKVVLGRC
jgi:hypothetical protein